LRKDNSAPGAQTEFKNKNKEVLKMISTSTIYSVIYDYLVNKEGIKNLDDQLAKGIWDGTNPTKTNGGVLALIALCAALRDDMRRKANKAEGKANIEKAMRAIIKNAPEYQKSLQGAIIIDGKQYVCDGYRAIRINTPIDLPIPPVPCTFDIAGHFAEAQVNAVKPLETPSLGDLKTHIKLKKAENKFNRGKNAPIIMWKFGRDLPSVNAVYLLDILTAFPDALITYSTSHAPLYFSHTEGDAILMPFKLS